MNKKEQLEDYISEVIICDTPKPSEHCKTNCPHGRFHEKQTGRDACHTPEFCSLSNAGIKKVKCKTLLKKDQKEWVEKELKK